MTASQDKEDDQPVIYVVDDDKSVRDSLEDLLDSVGWRSMTFDSAQAFARSERPDAPACLVLDVRMPGLSGLDFQHDMARLGIHVPIVFMTAHGDIPMSVRAMKAGAVEFLTKPFRDQDLLDAIQRGVARDRAFRKSAQVQAELFRRYASLSEGERAVMNRVAAGLLNKQIAAELSLSEVTVKVRRAQVMRKMQADSLADLVRFSDRIHGTNEQILELKR